MRSPFTREHTGALPKHQARVQQGAADGWGSSNHTGTEAIEELWDRLVITELDQELLPHVGVERPKSTGPRSSAELSGAGVLHRAREMRRRGAALVTFKENAVSDVVLTF